MDIVPTKLPISLVIGSPVYGSSRAPWDTPAHKFSPEQLRSLVEAATHKSALQRMTFAFLIPLEMALELRATLDEICSAGTEIVIVHFTNMAPLNGPFYVNT